MDAGSRLGLQPANAIVVKETAGKKPCLPGEFPHAAERKFPGPSPIP
jgi:hypothetical protein